MGFLDAIPNTTPPASDLIALGKDGWVPCLTNGRSFMENAQSTQLSDPAHTQVTYYGSMGAAFDFGYPRLVFQNVTWNATGGTAGGEVWGSPITITASIETAYTAGATLVPPKHVIQATFGGRAAGVMKGGGPALLISDPVPIHFRALQKFRVRVCVSSPTPWPMSWPAGDPVLVDSGEGFWLDSDATLATTGAGFTAPTNFGTGMFMPTTLIAKPASSAPGVLVLGDSIARGYNDRAYIVNHDYAGCVARALRGSGRGVLQMGAGGDRADQAAQYGWLQQRMLYAPACQHAVITYGTNDLQVDSAATVETNLTLIWRQVAAYGLKVWATTVPPRSTSTDNFQTPGNQTTAATNAARVTVNTWLRAGAPIDSTSLAPVAVGTGGALVAGNAKHPLAGVFDIATPMETAQDSGIWAAGVTGTADVSAGSLTLLNATGGPWAPGMRLAGPLVGSGLFISTVVGSTLTLTSQVGAPAPSGTGLASAITAAPTTDGIHPNPTMYAAGAAGIPASFATSRSGVALIPSGSPYTYQNLDGAAVDIIVSGGTVTDISYSLDNSTWTSTGLTSGEFRLEAADYIRITYSTAPTVLKVPKS